MERGQHWSADSAAFLTMFRWVTGHWLRSIINYKCITNFTLGKTWLCLFANESNVTPKFFVYNLMIEVEGPRDFCKVIWVLLGPIKITSLFYRFAFWGERKAYSLLHFFLLHEIDVSLLIWSYSQKLVNLPKHKNRKQKETASLVLPYPKMLNCSLKLSYPTLQCAFHPSFMYPPVNSSSKYLVCIKPIKRNMKFSLPLMKAF